MAEDVWSTSSGLESTSERRNRLIDPGPNRALRENDACREIGRPGERCEDKHSRHASTYDPSAIFTQHGCVS